MASRLTEKDVADIDTILRETDAEFARATAAARAEAQAALDSVAGVGDGDRTEAALVAARVAAARDIDASYLVSEQVARLRIDDLNAMHYLRRRGRFFDYCARIDVDAPLPRLVFARRGTPVIDVSADLVARAPAHDALAATLVYTRAPALARAFANDAVAHALPEWNFRVVFRAEHEHLTVVEIDVDVGDAQSLERPVRFATIVGRIARALAESRVVFAESVVDKRPPAARVLDVVERLAESVAWLSGPVERVGDGVEARLALDEQPELPSVLRIDLDGDGRHSVFFEGRFTHGFDVDVDLRPQRAFLDRVRGLADAKSGDAAFDDAWLCSGDPAVLRLLAAQEAVFRVLGAANATLHLGAAGLTVRTPLFSSRETAAADARADDVNAVRVDVLDVASAVLALWRSLVRHQHGRDLGHAVSQLVKPESERP